jgi:hypothetical protein
MTATDVASELVSILKQTQPARQELAFSLYPEGLRYSPETHYFEAHNTLLMSGLQEMMDGLLSGSLVGVPDGI